MKDTAFPVLTENEERLPFYLMGLGLDHVQQHIIRSKGYPYYQWIQCRSGSGRLVIGDEEYFVEKDQGMFILPGVAHEYYSDTDDDWIVDWAALVGPGTEAFLRDTVQFIESGVYHLAQPHILRSVMEQMLTSAQSDSPVKGLDLSALTYSFLTNLRKLASPAHGNSVDSRYNRLAPIFAYVEEHYAEAITLKQLADLMGVTPQHLCTLFRKIMNTRIFEYINLVRIQKSKEMLLSQPSQAIRDVAHQNGFEDVSYFCYIFKRIEKITPGDFRKLYIRN